jgi:hypothetical protein
MALSEEDKGLKARADKAWTVRQQWDTILRDAYALAIPNRRPSSDVTKGQDRSAEVFDSTLVDVCQRGAGRLHEAFFTPGQPFAKLDVSPLVKLAGANKPGAAKQIEDERKQLEMIGLVAYALCGTGEFEMATAEFCLDLMIGTGALLMLEGNEALPARFCSIPIDEIAVELDGYNQDCLILWRKKMSRRQIMDRFPEGKFPEEWKRDTERSTEAQIDQIFAKAAKGWTLTVTCEGCDDVISTGKFRTQPLIIGRYMRASGEELGRGPVLLALADGKTLNKAKEIQLRAALMDMLGIFLFRPGGAFNPQTARLAPGAMWPVTTTGGVMGADVSRLDTGPSRVDVGKLVTDDLRASIRSIAADDVRTEGGATPISATEVAARASRRQQAHRAAFTRMGSDVIPKIVLRLVDIAQAMRLLPQAIKLDQMLTRVEITSPMVQAIRASQIQNRLEYAQLVAAISGPDAVDEYIEKDVLLDSAADDLGMPQSQRVGTEKRMQIRQAKQQQAQAREMAMLALEAAKATKGAAPAEPQQPQPMAGL